MNPATFCSKANIQTAISPWSPVSIQMSSLPFCPSCVFLIAQPLPIFVPFCGFLLGTVQILIRSQRALYSEPLVLCLFKPVLNCDTCIQQSSLIVLLFFNNSSLRIRFEKLFIRLILNNKIMACTD